MEKNEKGIDFFGSCKKKIEVRTIGCVVTCEREGKREEKKKRNGENFLKVIWL